jgi:hypothetical protein
MSETPAYIPSENTKKRIDKLIEKLERDLLPSSSEPVSQGYNAVPTQAEFDHLEGKFECLVYAFTSLLEFLPEEQAAGFLESNVGHMVLKDE